jgi:hypothetical protein
VPSPPDSQFGLGAAVAIPIENNHNEKRIQKSFKNVIIRATSEQYCLTMSTEIVGGRRRPIATVAQLISQPVASCSSPAICCNFSRTKQYF